MPTAETFTGKPEDLMRQPGHVTIGAILVNRDPLRCDMAWIAEALLRMPHSLRQMIAAEMRLQADALESGKAEEMARKALARSEAPKP